MIADHPITSKTISTFLVEMVLFIILGYPNTTALRAPIILLAFIWTCINKMTSQEHNKGSAIHIWWAVSMIVLVLASKSWALEPQGIDDIKNNVLWSAMITLIMADYVTRYRIQIPDITKLLMPIAVFFILSVIFFGNRDHENRLSVTSNANSFGMIAVGMMSYFMYCVFKTQGDNKLCVVLSISLLLIGLLTGSRKSIISIAIYFVLYFLFLEKNNDLNRSVLKVFAFLGILVVVYILIMNVSFLYSTIGNRIESLLQFMQGDEYADGSAYSRMNMLNLAEDIIRSHPILGIGANNFKYYTYYGTYSHNGYTEIMCSFGIVGLLVYYGPLIRMMLLNIKSWKCNIQDAIFPLSIYIVFFVCEVGGVSYFAYYNYCFLGMAFGLTINRIQEQKTDTSNSDAA